MLAKWKLANFLLECVFDIDMNQRITRWRIQRVHPESYLTTRRKSGVNSTREFQQHTNITWIFIKDKVRNFSRDWGHSDVPISIRIRIFLATDRTTYNWQKDKRDNVTKRKVPLKNKSKRMVLTNNKIRSERHEENVSSRTKYTFFSCLQRS